jgi:hypothetical protein
MYIIYFVSTIPFKKKKHKEKKKCQENGLKKKKKNCFNSFI